MEFNFECLDHVQLAIPPNGEEKARQFYGELLGFRELEKPPLLKKRGGVWFRLGSIDIHLGVEEDFVAAKKAHPAIRVQHIDNLKKYVTDKQIKIELDDQLPGANRFYMYDPYGNRLEFIEWE